MGKTIERIGFGIIIVLLIIGVTGWVLMMVEYNESREECAKEHGGSVIRGYCTYVKEGTSESYNVWDNKLKEKKE